MAREWTTSSDDERSPQEILDQQAAERAEREQRERDNR